MMLTTKRTKAAKAAGTHSAPARVLIVPDKFKGTLAAADVCTAIAKGWQSVHPTDHLKLLPMSDGGDGFGEVMSQLLNARCATVRTLDAAHRPIQAKWWWEPDQKLAIIESAQVIGLAQLPPKKFHPFQLDTFGLGRVIAKTVQAGARHCVIGIGGSATNDAGFGLARALGWNFLDRNNLELKQWWQLNELARVVPGPACKLDITVAVDVLNPLLGLRGCSRVYGLQKGIQPQELPFIEKCLRRLTVILEQQPGIAHARTPGAGAAGGLGFGLLTFAGAKVRSGFEVFAQAADLETHIVNSDLVITGEGAVDRQTFMGKGVGQIISRCKKHKVPCLVLAGAASPDTKTVTSSPPVFTLTEITTLHRAKTQPQYHLEKLSAMLARNELLSQSQRAGL